jgi:hypothetical protein
MQNIKLRYAYGIYQVGSKQFINKTDALIYATESNESVHWNFHDQVYNKYDWTKRPTGTLQDMYFQRARQIRDQYDYVIVNFSGGADSWTVLHSFLSNNLHVDEIFTRWSMIERKYKPANFLDTRESNLTSEYEYAVVPVLEQIKKKYPRVNIHIDDYSNEYEKDIREHDLKNSGHYLALGTFFRFTRKSPGEQQAIKQGKKIAVVHGFDKIQFCVEDKNACAYFVDRIGGTDQDPERNIEAFYWTPDMPELPIMQAHEIKTFYELNPNLINESIRDFERKTYVKTCYPDYNPDTFQVGKPIGTEIWQSELWIRQHNPRYVESWQWAVNQNLNNIDSRFCEFYNNKLRLGYKTIKSRMYSLGTILNFDTQI